MPSRVISGRLSEREALQELGAEQAALRRVAVLVAEVDSPCEVFAKVAEEARNVLGSVECELWRDEGDGTAVVVAASGEAIVASFPVGTRVPVDDDGVTASVLRHGRPHRIDGYSSASAAVAEGADERGIRSAVGCPIVVRGGIWGAIVVATFGDEPCPPEAERRLGQFAEPVATAIANAAARGEIERLADEQAALRRVATLVARGAGPEQVFVAVAEEVSMLFSDPAVSAIVRFERDESVTVLADRGGWNPSGVRVELDPDYVVAAVRKTRCAARFDAEDPAAADMPDIVRSRAIRSAVAAPVIADGELWGAVTIVSFDRSFPPATERRLADFTDLIATAVANAQASEQMTALADEQAALRRVATLVARDAPSTEVFVAVATEVGKLFDTDITVVGRYDADGMATAIGSWSAEGGGVPAGTRSAIGGRNVLTLVAETGQPARVDGYDDASGHAADIARRYGWRSSIAAPILVEGRVWGVMLVATQRAEPFFSGAEHKLAAFTDLVATAVANAQTHDELLRFGDEQAALGRVATLVAAGASQEQVFGAVVAEASNLVGLERIELVRFNGVSGTVIAASGDHPFPAGSTWSLDDPSVMATVARTGHAARIDDYSALDGEIARSARSARFQSAIGAPITVEGRLWGVIIAISTDAEPIPERSEERLGQFTGLVASAIANAESRDALARLADEQAALRRVATFVAKGAAPAELFAAVSAEVDRVFHFDTATSDVSGVVRFEPGPELLVVGVSKSVEAVPLGSRFPTDELFAPSRVLRTGRSARIRAADVEAAGTEAADFLRHHGYLSQVASPIVVEGRLWGAISANSRNDLPPDTEERLERFTDLVATAIANAESRDALARLADEQVTLRRIATLVAEGLQPEEIFAAVSEEVATTFGCAAGVQRFDHDGPASIFVGVSRGTDIPIGTRWEFVDGMVSAEVYRTGRSARAGAIDWSSSTGPVAEAGERLGIVSQVGTPVIVDGNLWGAITVNAQEELPPDTETRLEKFTELVATAVANAESKSELAASRRRIVAASDETRRQIERDLHDGTQQRLVSLGLAIRAAEASLPPEQDDVRATLSGVADGLADALEDLQEISRGIHPAILSKGGLAPALRTLAKRSTIPVNLDITAEDRLPEPIEVAAYFVASEALANAAKHSQASCIDLSLAEGDGRLRLAIRDDGVGGADAARGSGLVGLADRVEALGGSISVHSREGSGTRMTTELPLELESPGPSGDT